MFSLMFRCIILRKRFFLKNTFALIQIGFLKENDVFLDRASLRSLIKSETTAPDVNPRRPHVFGLFLKRSDEVLAVNPSTRVALCC